MNKRLLSTVTFGMMCVVAFAQQQPPAGAAPGRGDQAAARRAAGVLMPGVPPRVIQSLNLSDTQKQQTRTILQQTRQSTQPLQQQVRDQRQAMAQAIKTNDSTKIQQVSATLGSLNGQMLAVRSGAMAQFYSLLLPDQQAKLDQARQRLRNRREQRGAGQGFRGGAGQQSRQGQGAL